GRVPSSGVSYGSLRELTVMVAAWTSHGPTFAGPPGQLNRISMAKHKEEHPTSLPDYLAIVESRQTSALHSLWYRGCGSALHTLLPSLYRHQKAKTPEAFADLERQLMTRFRQRSIPYHNRSLVDDWDALFFMQHYGVP